MRERDVCCHCITQGDESLWCECVLQCVAVRCSALQCVVNVSRKGMGVCGVSVLHCVIVCCSVLQCVVVCCSVLHSEANKRV